VVVGAEALPDAQPLQDRGGPRGKCLATFGRCRPARSSTPTRSPSRAMVMAAAAPAGPPPMTARSSGSEPASGNPVPGP
jgi:hypothetical protein